MNSTSSAQVREFDHIHNINGGTESLLQEAETRLLELSIRFGVDVPPRPTDGSIDGPAAPGVLGQMRADAVAVQRRVENINHILSFLSNL
jgi:hypothetical protein